MITSLLSFLDSSPVNFYAVATLEERLSAAGFRKLDAAQPMPALKAGDQVYFTKNDSSLYAFRIGRKPMADAGIRLVCAHCDSPTFRVKPNAEMRGDGNVMRLNTEVYGGAILSTWFDRPLSLAGRVLLRTQDPLHPQTRLLRIEKPILTIPNLAIHFNRQVNDGVALSKQRDMLPILGIINDELERNNTLMQIVAKELAVDMAQILDFDLYLYDTTPAQLVGLHDEFVQSGRLDDLSMVHAGLEGLLADNSTPNATQCLAIFDNEETGSGTKQGAGSPFLQSLLERLVMAQGGSADDFYRCVENSFMVSADNAHAWHPNYDAKYDPTNHPVMGGGPVIKFNASQKYASDADSAAVFEEVCRIAGVPCQKFVNHSDVAGGSTLGNILTGSLPLRGVDMGNPIWAMHSVRETGNCNDHIYCIKAFSTFFAL